MDHGQLPCVLLMAEFHERYISSILKRAHGWDEKTLRDKLPDVYFSIYKEGGAPFASLWKVAKIVLGAANVKVAERMIAFEHKRQTLT
jgi:hypothetical protein